MITLIYYCQSCEDQNKQHVIGPWCFVSSKTDIAMIAAVRRAAAWSARMRKGEVK